MTVIEITGFALSENARILPSSLEDCYQLIAAKDTVIAKKDTLIALLEEKLRLAQIARFAKSSEKTDLMAMGQVDCFADEAFDVPEDNGESESVTVPAHERRRGKRKPFPEYLPRERMVHELPEDELLLDNGLRYVKIGEEISSQLDVVPAKVTVVEHVRYKYAVPGFEEYGVKTAPYSSKQPLPKSIASSGLLAHIVQHKYEYHLPLYRQAQMWQSCDIDISRSSMCRWLKLLGIKAAPVIAEILEQMKLEPMMQADETRLTVINDNNKKAGAASHGGWMWVYTNKAGVVYDYQSTRAGKHPKQLLEEFKGFIQSDAYGGYNALFTDDTDKISVGCWAHARRKYTEVVKSVGKKKKPPPLTAYILKFIGKLYTIEQQVRERQLDADGIYAVRQAKAVPILKRLKACLDENAVKTPPKSLLGKAIGYTLNNWAALSRYVDSGHTEIDNNSAERRVKPFAVGRKNWLFSGNTETAMASANLFTLVENAKLYNLKVHGYLKYVFEGLAAAKTPRDFECLTPRFAREVVAHKKTQTQK